MEAGYATKSVNVSISAANGLMLYMGHRGLQTGRLPEAERIQPELTRAEYLRLLSAARTLGKEKLYLLVKVFGTTGLSVGSLESLTAEAVQEGEITLSSGTLRIPGGLRGELMHFMGEEGIATGPIFLSKKGKPQDRTAITPMIRSLCHDAQVPEEKANPRCLRKLYLTTRDSIRENLSRLEEQAYDRLLEKEQGVVGWDN